MAETSKAAFFTQAQMDAAIKAARKDGERDGMSRAREFLDDRAADLEGTGEGEWATEAAILRWAALRVQSLP